MHAAHEGAFWNFDFHIFTFPQYLYTVHVMYIHKVISKRCLRYIFEWTQSVHTSCTYIFMNVCVHVYTHVYMNAYYIPVHMYTATTLHLNSTTVTVTVTVTFHRYRFLLLFSSWSSPAIQCPQYKFLYIPQHDCVGTKP